MRFYRKGRYDFLTTITLKKHKGRKAVSTKLCDKISVRFNISC